MVCIKWVAVLCGCDILKERFRGGATRVLGLIRKTDKWNLVIKGEFRAMVMTCYFLGWTKKYLTFSRFSLGDSKETKN